MVTFFFFWIQQERSREESGQQTLRHRATKVTKPPSVRLVTSERHDSAPHSSPNIADKGPHQPHHESTARTGNPPRLTRLSRDVLHAANEVARVRDALSISYLLTSSVVDWPLLGEWPLGQRLTNSLNKGQGSQLARKITVHYCSARLCFAIFKFSTSPGSRLDHQRLPCLVLLPRPDPVPRPFLFRPSVPSPVGFFTFLSLSPEH